MAGIFNYTELDDKLTIGGQPMVMQFDELEKAGFETIIQIKVVEAEFVLQDEAYHVEQHNMEHAAMEMSFGNPTLDNVREFFAMMDSAQGKKVFAHCAAGFCASGMVMMYKMIRDGMSYTEAIDSYTVDNWQPNDAWTALMDEANKAGL